jgi:myosin heavy chain 9/10/11/14
MELALIRERAERDKLEREALEGLKMTLETEKRKVEDQLEAERALALDKDELLDRSKKREAELEQEVHELQSDLDTLDSHLDRAMKIQKESEEKHEALRQAFDQAAEHLIRLESEQQEWLNRETELSEQLGSTQADVEALRIDRDKLQKVNEELRNIVDQREEDLSRTRERMDIAVNELESKLSTELKFRYVAQEFFWGRLEIIELCVEM